MQDDRTTPNGAQRLSYLVVAAHPDDADFGVAGTAAKLAREGHAVHYLVCTSGDAGTEDPSQPPEELARLREAEQDTAAGLLGLAGTHYLRLQDGALEPSLALRRTIVRAIRQVKADVVLSLDPRTLMNDDSTYLNHPDHRAAGQATLDAAYPAAGNPGAYRELLAEGLPPHRVREVWLYFTNAHHANHWVDITDTLELKIRALEAHSSQIGDWAANGGLRREITKWAEEEAQRHRLPYRFAEGFQRVVLRSEEPERPPEAEALEAQAEDS
jgi:LmbE family N-acetylglucosaminyl deacetylase